MTYIRHTLQRRLSIALLAASLMLTTSLRARDCEGVLSLCEASETHCRTQLKQDEEVIATLLKQRNEAFEFDAKASSSSIVDLATPIIVGVAIGVIITRGLR